jgi:hypothetical protein
METVVKTSIFSVVAAAAVAGCAAQPMYTDASDTAREYFSGDWYVNPNLRAASTMDSGENQFGLFCDNGLCAFVLSAVDQRCDKESSYTLLAKFFPSEHLRIIDAVCLRESPAAYAMETPMSMIQDVALNNEMAIGIQMQDGDPAIMKFSLNGSLQAMKTVTARSQR